MSKFMKAVILKKPYQLEIKEIPIPKPKSDEVLIKVRACGICGSDIRYYMGENPWSLHTLGYDQPMPPNVILGHEVSGEIVEVGYPEESYRIGQRVSVIAAKTCEECYYCRKGLANLCEKTLHIGHNGNWKNVEYIPGGYAEYMVVWSTHARSIPNNISFIEATQLDGLAVAIHAVRRRGKVKTGDKVLIIGTGAIGLMIGQVAKIYGAELVVGVDIREKPLEVASKLGFDEVINAKKEDLVKKVDKLTKGLGVNVVFDTVGTKQTFTQGLRALARAGRYILLAVSKTKIDFELTWLAGERTLTTSANFLFPDFNFAIELLSYGRVRVKPFITHVFKLEEIHEAFKVAMNKEEYDAIKVVVVP